MTVYLQNNSVKVKYVCVLLFCIKYIVADISFSTLDSGDQEKIQGPRGDDYSVYWNTARGKDPSGFHPQANCFDHPRG